MTLITVAIIIIVLLPLFVGQSAHVMTICEQSPAIKERRVQVARCLWQPADLRWPAQAHAFPELRPY